MLGSCWRPKGTDVDATHAGILADWLEERYRLVTVHYPDGRTDDRGSVKVVARRLRAYGAEWEDLATRRLRFHFERPGTPNAAPAVLVLPPGAPV